MISTVVFDTWAWWEILRDTLAGKRLSKKYLEEPESRVLTVDLALVEIAVKMARDGAEAETKPALNAVEAGSEVVPISRAAAEAAGPLLVHLRKTDRNASVADAVMLAVARDAGAKLVSGDACFARERDVITG